MQLPKDLKIQEPFLAGSVFRIEREDHPAVARARYAEDLDFVRPEYGRAYEAALAEGMQRLVREKPRPAGIETRVARAVVATRGTDGHGLALAMTEALERGTTAMADGIREERSAGLAELQQDAPEDRHPTDLSVRKQRLLRRVCASFTGAEVRETMLELQRDARSWDPSPWRGRQEAVAREQGRFMGAEIEPR